MGIIGWYFGKIGGESVFRKLRLISRNCWVWELSLLRVIFTILISYGVIVIGIDF